MLTTAPSAHPVLLLVLLFSLCGCSDTPPPVTDQATTPAPAASTTAAKTAPAKPPPPVSPQAQFWSRLTSLCGNAYAGYLTVGTEDSDRKIGESDLTIHVSECAPDEIRIPFHVGEDRSRTFIVRRLADAITLHHRHLDENGVIAEPNGYGGSTRAAGTPLRQEFVVDAATKAKLPATQYNVWAIEVAPGKLFAYELQRPEEERFFRVEFELQEAIAPPPPAWGDG